MGSPDSTRYRSCKRWPFTLSTPAVDGRHLYFNDMSGFLTKLDRFTGKLVWRKNYVNDLSVPGFVVKSSRNTPLILKVIWSSSAATWA